jgi:hypothetical protein
MSTPYRTAALAVLSREVTAWGTGEKLVLTVPMAPAEVVQRLGQLTQTQYPNHKQEKAGDYRPFKGVAASHEFELQPLRPRAKMLSARVRLEGRADLTVVTVDIRLPMGRTALMALVVVIPVIVILVKYGLPAFAYMVFRIGGAVCLVALLTGAAVRVGIGNVREVILKQLRGEEPAPVQLDPHEEYPPLFTNPVPLADRLDAWLRERLK